MRIQIGVIGASELAKTKTKLAEELGREIARNKAILLAGTTEGVSGVAAKGAKKDGGLTIAIIFKKYTEEELKYFDGVIFTGLSRGFDILVKASDGIIAVGGGAGTLREIAFAYKEGKPIVALEGAGGWADKLVNTQLDSKGSKIYGVKTPKKAINLLLKLIRKKENIQGKFEKRL